MITFSIDRAEESGLRETRIAAAVCRSIFLGGFDRHYDSRLRELGVEKRLFDKSGRV
jgi:hypothetical protein